MRYIGPVKIQSAHATFVVTESGTSDPERCAWPLSPKLEPVVYSDGEDALGAVQRRVG